MSDTINILINGQPLALRFGYGATRRLGGYLGEDSFDGTIGSIMGLLSELTELEKLDKLEGGNLSFETLDKLGYLVLSGLPEDAGVSLEDCVDFVFADMGKLTLIMEAWSASMPKANKQKKTVAKKPKVKPRSLGTK